MLLSLQLPFIVPYLFLHEMYVMFAEKHCCLSQLFLDLHLWYQKRLILEFRFIYNNKVLLIFYFWFTQCMHPLKYEIWHLLGSNMRTFIEEDLIYFKILLLKLSSVYFLRYCFSASAIDFQKTSSARHSSA